METRTPADELLSSVISSPSAKEDLETVWKCLGKSTSLNPTLASFRDIDKATETLSVLHGTNNAVDYLVYGNAHEHAGQEAYFDVAGYITSLTLPSHRMSNRSNIFLWLL